MKPSELIKAVRCCIEAKQPVCIWSEPGLGKTSMCKQITEALGNDYEFKNVRGVLLDPTDLRGLPHIKKDGTAAWASPDFLPKTGTKGVLLTDELNRAPQLVQNACLGLVLERELGEYKLPDGWAVVAACNPNGGGTQKMSEALRNRFVHLTLEADLNDWCKWAIDVDIEPVVIAFLRFRPELLHKPDPKANAFPTPRSWEFVSKIVAAHPGNGIEHALYVGAVGEGAAVEFSAFLRLYREVPDIDAILLNPKTAAVPTQPATLYAVSAALARRASDNNLGRIIQYLDRMPMEYSVMCIKDALQKTPTLTSTSDYTKWAVKNQEVFA